MHLPSKKKKKPLRLKKNVNSYNRYIYINNICIQTVYIYTVHTYFYQRIKKKKYYTAVFKRELEPLQNVQIIAMCLLLRTMLTVPSTLFYFCPVSEPVQSAKDTFFSKQREFWGFF